MSKLAALLPLLGWFYLSLIIAMVITWMLPPVWKQRWQRTVLSVVCIFTLVLAARNIAQELQLSPAAWKAWITSAQSKIDNDTGTYYQMYYQAFRPFVPKDEKAAIQVVDVSAKEYLYARMYISPNSVLNVPKVVMPTDKPVWVIASVNHLPAATIDIRARFQDKVLAVIWPKKS